MEQQSNTYQSILASGYEPQPDPSLFAKLQYLVAFKAEVFDRTLEVQGSHKDQARATKIQRCYAGSLKERPANELRLDIALAEARLRSELLGL